MTSLSASSVSMKLAYPLAVYLHTPEECPILILDGHFSYVSNEDCRLAITNGYAKATLPSDEPFTCSLLISNQ